MGNSCCCCVNVREAVSKKKRRTVLKYSPEVRTVVPESGVNLDLVAVHHRIIAMGFPSVGFEALYRNPLEQVREYLDLNFGDKYQVYNLCAEKKHQYDPSRFYGRVKLFPFFDHHPCALSMIVDFVDDAAGYLREVPERVVVIHCKAGKGRTGLMACCLMMQLQQNLIGRADDAVKEYGVARTLDGKGLTHRSQIRYVQYWGRLQREFDSRYPIGGGPVIELQALEIHHVLQVVTAISTIVIMYNEGKEELVLSENDKGTFQKTGQWCTRIDLARVGDAMHSPARGSRGGLLLKDDFRIEFRSSPKGKCLGAVGAHTLFVEPKYDASVMDKLYKNADLPSAACLALEYS